MTKDHMTFNKKRDSIGQFSYFQPIMTWLLEHPRWQINMVDRIPRTLIRNGIGLESPNFGSNCKGDILILNISVFLEVTLRNGSENRSFVSVNSILIRYSLFTVKLKIFSQDDIVKLAIEKEIVIGEGKC